MRPFDILEIFDDAIPHAAAVNMAIDETLLLRVQMPTLRCYRWARPAVSFGYFEKWEPVRAAHPHREPVRRWTGGGVVPHGDGEDWTYSLLLPAAAACRAFADAELTKSYRIIHEAAAGALAAVGINNARTCETSAARTSPACFENPVRFDVMLAGRKIAGAAQRRTAAGVLHQGSIRCGELPARFAEEFAQRLARKVRATAIDLPPEATDLATAKYGSLQWLTRA